MAKNCTNVDKTMPAVNALDSTKAYFAHQPGQRSLMKTPKMYEKNSVPQNMDRFDGAHTTPPSTVHIQYHKSGIVTKTQRMGRATYS